MTLNDIFVLVSFSLFAMALAPFVPYFKDGVLGDDNKLQLIEALGLVSILLIILIVFLSLLDRFDVPDNIFTLTEWLAGSAIVGKAATSVGTKRKNPRD